MAKYEVKVAEKIIEVKIKPEKFQIQLVKMLHFSVKTSLKNWQLRDKNFSVIWLSAGLFNDMEDHF